MFGSRTTPIQAARRVLSEYLPQTLVDVTKITSPVRTTAVRVLYARDAAFDYYEADGQWYRVSATAAGVLVGAHTGDGPHAIGAVVAADIASWHRKIAYPLSSDSRPSLVSDMRRAESEDRITEAMDYLYSVARGKIMSTIEAREFADSLWNRIDDEMVDSVGEHKTYAPLGTSVMTF